MRPDPAWNSSRLGGLKTPLFGAALVALALVVILGGERELDAHTGPNPDADGDFLVIEQERILGTSPTSADTDQDGFSDLEELARGSSPIDGLSVPAAGRPVHVGMAAHAGADDKIHVLVAVHSALANPREIRVNLGVQAQRRVGILSQTWVAANSTHQLTTGANGQDLVHLLDVAIDPAHVLALGQLTFFATVSVAGSGTILAADVVRLIALDGIVVLVMPPPRPGNSQQQQAPSQPGSIYVPLPTVGTGGMPATWSVGEICFQRSMPVAVNGPIITQEIVSANCLNGWEGYCPPSCVATVGSTYTTVDPIGLLGG
ncbi:MAG: hypothetical protein JNK02_13845 [Planctomycetes bacterium]|nr:hypothetical protein [Planctomycetota bacterium]